MQMLDSKSEVSSNNYDKSSQNTNRKTESNDTSKDDGYPF